jgi:hypothetical protein
MLILDMDDPRRRLHKLPPSTSLVDRVLLRGRADESGCWIFGGAVDSGGYGMIRMGALNIRAHRVTYEAVNGPVPADLHVDHLCRVRACCNPEHLEAIAVKANTWDRAFWASGFPKATHCPRGHEKTDENTYRRPDGKGTNCLACVRRRSAAIDPAKNRARSLAYVERNRDEVNRRKRERRARA